MLRGMGAAPLSALALFAISALTLSDPVRPAHFTKSEFFIGDARARAIIVRNVGLNALVAALLATCRRSLLIVLAATLAVSLIQCTHVHLLEHLVVAYVASGLG
jgi:hypothetical protein